MSEDMLTLHGLRKMGAVAGCLGYDHFKAMWGDSTRLEYVVHHCRRVAKRLIKPTRWDRKHGCGALEHKAWLDWLCTRDIRAQKHLPAEALLVETHLAPKEPAVESGEMLSHDQLTYWGVCDEAYRVFWCLAEACKAAIPLKKAVEHCQKQHLEWIDEFRRLDPRVEKHLAPKPEPDVFEPRRLQKGDEIKVDAETCIPVTNGHFHEPENVCFAVDETYPNEILLGWCGYHYSVLDQVLRTHITRVVRDGVQIWPTCPERERERPEPKYALEQEILDPNCELPRKVVDRRFDVVQNAWEYDLSDGCAGTFHPESDLKPAPPPCPFKVGDWVEHPTNGLGKIRIENWCGKVGVNWLKGPHYQYYAKKDLKPYEPPIEEVYDMLVDGSDDDTTLNDISKAINDRFILIRKPEQA